MAIAIILLGTVSGLASVIAALLIGAPLWVALLTYPLAGLVSAALAIAFASASLQKEETSVGSTVAEA
ncbi:MAG: hypothetical protein ACK4RN_10220 [Pseudorhodobacter sp.]